MRDRAAELRERARSEDVEFSGVNGLLTAPVRQAFQTGREVEMTDHFFWWGSGGLGQDTSV